MAKEYSLLQAWWGRLRGRLQPALCPFAHASEIEMPGRHLVAGVAQAGARG
jgi:hypothetical protein